MGIIGFTGRLFSFFITRTYLIVSFKLTRLNTYRLRNFKLNSIDQ